MDNIPVQHDALDLSIKRTTCPSETAKDSAKKPPEKGCPGGESSAKETPEDEEKTDGNGSVLQHDSEEKRKLLEEYIEASEKRSNEEEKDHGIKWASLWASSKHIGLPKVGVASSRKRFCNEDISLRFQSPPGRESLERQSSFPLSDASLVSPGGLSVLSGHSQGSDIEAVYGRDTGVPKEIIRTVNQVSVRLQEEELWNAFGALQTEMIINRGGRRMFPHIIVAIKGLDPEERYTVAMEILDADNRRYKYVKNQWMAMGTADPGPARHVYVHPDSPNSGAVWTKNCVSFAKVRLTNNKESKESILINSMHKYMVAVTIKEEAYNGDVMRFNFPETGFIAVTAYQNNAITQLKIKNNPFAKAFRDEAVSSKRSGHMEELRVIGNRNRNTCNGNKTNIKKLNKLKRAQKVTAPWEEQFRVRQLRMHDMIEQGVKSCSQPLCELNVPSGVGFGCYGGPSSLYNWPWISNIGYSYPLPTMMAMWHHDRQYYSAGPGPPTQESPSISPRSGQSSSPTFSNDQSLNSNSTMD